MQHIILSLSLRLGGTSDPYFVNNIYYVDNAGSDSNTGLAGHPWQTCAKVNTLMNADFFSPGDRILFTAGQTFTGPLNITQSGTANKWLYFGSTGTTPGYAAFANPAIITAPDGTDYTSGAGIYCLNNEYVWVNALKVVGSGVNPSTGVTTSKTAGVLFYSDVTVGSKWQSCRITSVTVTDCYFGIIVLLPDGSSQAVVGYNDLRLWGCLVYNTKGSAIQVSENVFPGENNNDFTNTYIGYCTAHDLTGGIDSLGMDRPILNGAMGITLRCCTTGTIEWCRVYSINPLGPGQNQGLGVGKSVSVICQYLEAWNVQNGPSTPTDGVGFDIEACTGCTLQYSYFHDNDGAGLLWGNGNSGCVARWNVFARNCGNNQAEMMVFNSNAGALFYSNTVYSTRADAVIDPQSGSYYNNIFFVPTGNKIFSDSSGAPAALIGNVYYASGGDIVIAGVTYANIAALRVAGFEANGGNNYGVFGDPQLYGPTLGTGTNDPVTAMPFFTIHTTSIAYQAGIPYAALSISPGSVDFNGNPIGSPPSSGSSTVLITGPVTHLAVVATDFVNAGTPTAFTVIGKDASNLNATAYAGTVTFTSSGSGVTLPANSTLPTGIGTFTATLATVGTRTITATDTVTVSITGVSDNIQIVNLLGYDTFSRADGTLLTADSPEIGTWLNYGSGTTAKCLNGQCTGNAGTPGNSGTAMTVSSADVTILLDWTNNQNNFFPYIAVRVAANGSGFLIENDGTLDTVNMLESDGAGGFPTVATASIPTTGTHAFKIVCNGSTISVYVDNVLAFAYASATRNQTTKNFGVTQHPDSSNPQSLDNWRIF